MSDYGKNSSETAIDPRDLEALREENRSWRAKAQEQGEAARRARDDARRAQEKADTAQRGANSRIIQAELRAAATQAGMIDLDGLKMADLSDVTLDDVGVVQGADAVLSTLRQQKPYLFGSGSRNGTLGVPPSGSSPRHASQMSKEEFERELKKLTRR